jgi:hypothetical protein
MTRPRDILAGIKSLLEIRLSPGYDVVNG